MFRGGHRPPQVAANLVKAASDTAMQWHPFHDEKRCKATRESR
jgi:hypothetical protein